MTDSNKTPNLMEAEYEKQLAHRSKMDQEFLEMMRDMENDKEWMEDWNNDRNNRAGFDDGDGSPTDDNGYPCK